MKKLFLSLIGCIGFYSAFACTNFLVGKDASADGSTIISYSADSYTQYGFLHFSPAQDFPKGAKRQVFDWETNQPLCTIDQVEHTYQVVGYINENQVAPEDRLGNRVMYYDREAKELSVAADYDRDMAKSQVHHRARVR